MSATTGGWSPRRSARPTTLPQARSTTVTFHTLCRAGSPPEYVPTLCQLVLMTTTVPTSSGAVARRDRCGDGRRTVRRQRRAGDDLPRRVGARSPPTTLTVGCGRRAPATSPAQVTGSGETLPAQRYRLRGRQGYALIVSISRGPMTERGQLASQRFGAKRLQ